MFTNTRPVTARGAKLLRDELRRLKNIERPAVIQAIAEARQQGDLSENADYDAAKDKQAFVEGRISEIESKLANARIVDPQELPQDGRVVFSTTVDLEELDTGTNVTYQIVGDDEANVQNGLLSISSPLARALIGKTQGNIATVDAPNGTRKYEILEVRYL